MTLSDLITQTRDWIDEPTPQNFTDATIIRFLNNAQQIISSEVAHEYEDYFEIQADLNATSTPPGTVAGQELYALPSDFLKFKRVERTDTGNILSAIDLNEKLTNSNVVTGLLSGSSPVAYYVSGNNIGFTPTPSSSIPIRMTYVQRLTDMDLTANPTSALPAEHHHLLAVWAAISCFIKDEADTSQLMPLWSEGLDRIRRTLRQRQIQEPKRVRRVANYGGLTR